ncbi:MAG: EamA family transporter [SAR116 cluster bacterium]|nr:EamA family transporter [SAR116 cluster bacterium]RPH10095.1 MAG: DMT family transporter [Alphaproteobacteria bacterium TMED54]|tara:strand:+ start:525 stop:1385 length:861 start_codon:yes stop_codon:yes gene_type:complete
MLKKISSKSPIIGIFWMIITTIFFVGVTIFVKILGETIPSSQTAFLRYLFGTIFLIPIIIKSFRNIELNLVNKFILRSFFHAIGVSLWFFSMTVITIAEVTAIGYLTPIFVCIGAIIFFNESLKGFRGFAIVLSFFGAMIILRPGFQEIKIGQLSMLLASFVFSFSYLMVKYLANLKTSLEIVGFLSLFTTLFLLPLAIVNWVELNINQFIILILISVIATLGHLTMTMAIKSTSMTIIQPFTFLQLVWSVIAGIIIFNEKLDTYVIIGGIIILISTTYLSVKDSK